MSKKKEKSEKKLLGKFFGGEVRVDR